LETQELIYLKKRQNLPTTTCPNCKMVWLAPGLNEGDTYECRGCLLSFVVGMPIEKTSQSFDDPEGKAPFFN